MAITPPAKPPVALVTPPDKKEEKKVAEWINSSPDGRGKAAPKYVIKGKKVQITHTIQKELLERIDATFPKMGMSSRASYINMAITQMLERGVSFDGQKDE